jgi:hypothetical protein
VVVVSECELFACLGLRPIKMAVFSFHDLLRVLVADFGRSDDRIYLFLITEPIERN